MYKVLVSDNVAQDCVDILAAEKEIEVDFKTGMSPEELNGVIGDYDAIIVRSATKVREEALDAATKLKVIGRAGTGVDNIDVPRATDMGVVVMNTPGGNTVSTGEHAFSLIMAMSRNIPQADRSMKNNEWGRKKYMGVELRGKTLGIIGLGNIGRVIAQRAVAFGMKVIGSDPFISKEMANRFGIELTDLEGIWADADYITVHTPLTDKTKYIICADNLAKCKDGVRIVNCARGGIVNEQDLLAAVESGKVAGAALDVYESEPPVDNPLVMHEKVICTPHLGASTSEAQDIVAVMIAEQVRDFLLTGEVRNAVNMPSMAPEVYEKVQPYMELCKNMGSFVGQMGEGQLSGIDIIYYGDLHSGDTWVMTSSVLEGLLSMGYAEHVNLLNAKSSAEKLGINVNEIKSSEEKDYKNCIEIKMKTDKGPLDILGTIIGKNNPRIVNINDYEVDFEPRGYLVTCSNHDKPGIIGNVGAVIGKRGINIANMTWARKPGTDAALMVLTADDKITGDAIDDLKKLEHVIWVKNITI